MMRPHEKGGAFSMPKLIERDISAENACAEGADFDILMLCDKLIGEGLQNFGRYGR